MSGTFLVLVLTNMLLVIATFFLADIAKALKILAGLP